MPLLSVLRRMLTVLVVGAGISFASDAVYANPAQQERYDTLAALALTLRVAGAEQTDAVSAQYPALGAVFESTISEKLPVTWPVFLRGAIVHIGAVPSSRPVIGFYNPWVDGWLLTQWSETGDEAGFTLTAAAAVTHAGLSDPGSVTTPDLISAWRIALETEPDLSRVLTDQAAGAARVFAERYPEAGRLAPALPTTPYASGQMAVEMRVMAELLALTPLMEGPVFKDMYGALIRFFRTGDPALILPLAAGPLSQSLQTAADARAATLFHDAEPRVFHIDPDAGIARAVFADPLKPGLFAIAVYEMPVGEGQGSLHGLSLGGFE